MSFMDRAKFGVPAAMEITNILAARVSDGATPFRGSLVKGIGKIDHQSLTRGSF